jgi:hypothetical protein
MGAPGLASETWDTAASALIILSDPAKQAVILSDPNPEQSEGEGESKDLRLLFRFNFN